MRRFLHLLWALPVLPLWAGQLDATPLGDAAPAPEFSRPEPRPALHHLAVSDPAHDLTIHTFYLTAPQDSIDVVAATSSSRGSRSAETLTVVDFDRRGAEDSFYVQRGHAVRLYVVLSQHDDVHVGVFYLTVEPPASEFPVGFYGFTREGLTATPLDVTGSIVDDTIAWHHKPVRGTVKSVAAVAIMYGCDTPEDCDAPFVSTPGPIHAALDTGTWDTAPDNLNNDHLATVEMPIWWSDLFP